jgi:hypothetical protein
VISRRVPIAPLDIFFEQANGQNGIWIEVTGLEMNSVRGIDWGFEYLRLGTLSTGQEMKLREILDGWDESLRQYGSFYANTIHGLVQS